MFAKIPLEGEKGARTLFPYLSRRKIVLTPFCPAERAEPERHRHCSSLDLTPGPARFRSRNFGGEHAFLGGIQPRSLPPQSDQR